MSKVVNKRGKNPSIFNSGKMISKENRKRQFKNKEKRPKVKILKGKEKKFKRGRKMTFASPKITPKKMIICQFLVKSKPK